VKRKGDALETAELTRAGALHGGALHVDFICPISHNL
jgi:hypothetical protein